MIAQSRGKFPPIPSLRSPRSRPLPATALYHSCETPATAVGELARPSHPLEDAC